MGERGQEVSDDVFCPSLVLGLLMSLLSRHMPTEFQAGFIGTMQLRGSPGFDKPVSYIKVKSKDIIIKDKSVRLKVSDSKKKRRKSRLGPYGRYLF